MVIIICIGQNLRNELGIPSSVDTLQCDLNDSNSIDSVVSKSKVLLSTAGPFAKIGLFHCMSVDSNSYPLS